MITGEIQKKEDCEKDKAVAMKNTIDKMANDNGEIKAGILITFHENIREPRLVALGLSPEDIVSALQIATIGTMSAVENLKNEENQAQA